MINYQKNQKGNATLSTIVIAACVLLIGSYVANNMDSITGKIISKLHTTATNSNPVDLISEANTLLANNDPLFSDLYALQSKLNDTSYPYTNTLNNLKNKVNNAIQASKANAQIIISNNNGLLENLYNQTSSNGVNNAIYMLESEANNFMETNNYRLLDLYGEIPSSIVDNAIILLENQHDEKKNWANTNYNETATWRTTKYYTVYFKAPHGVPRPLYAVGEFAKNHLDKTSTLTANNFFNEYVNNALNHTDKNQLKENFEHIEDTVKNLEARRAEVENFFASFLKNNYEIDFSDPKYEYLKTKIIDKVNEHIK